MASVAALLLLASWQASGSRLDQRCTGLTDAEYRWRPVADA